MQGVYTTLLGGDGRMISDLVVVCVTPDEFIVSAPQCVRDILASQIEKYIIMENVQVSDLSEEFATLCVVGPLISDLFEGIVHPEKSASVTASMVSIGGESSLIFQGPWPTNGAWTFVKAELANACYDDVFSRVAGAGGMAAGSFAWNTMRIEDGIPEFGTDMNSSTIPLEAGLEHAIDFNKGCFPGQEIVARISNLGHPAKKLVGLRLAPEDFPEIGAEIQWDGNPIGSITSAAISPALNEAIALGTVKWAAREAGTIVQVMEENRAIPAVVTELPFNKS
jgi:folate-binding protein YgfZ